MSKTFYRCVFGLIGLYLQVVALAISPARPPTPGIAFLASGDCQSFSKTVVEESNKNDINRHYWGWYLALQKLPMNKQMECLTALPIPRQYDLLINSIRQGDKDLLSAWLQAGGKINEVRSNSGNLATMATTQGNLPLLYWLKSEGLRPLAADDPFNEIASLLTQGGDIYQSLLTNGYSLPSRADNLHRILGGAVQTRDVKYLKELGVLIQSRGWMPRVLTYEKDQAGVPLVLQARSANAMKLIQSWGFNLHATRVDRRTGRVNVGNAFYQFQEAETLLLLLDAKLEVNNLSDPCNSALSFAMSKHPKDLALLERFLKAGADVKSPCKQDSSDYMHQLASAKLAADELRALIRLLVHYGANPNNENLDFDHYYSAIRARNLPIHTAISFGNVKTVQVWLDESKIQATVKHPKTGQSLIGFALSAGNSGGQQAIELIQTLMRLGTPLLSEPNESHVLTVLTKPQARDMQLLQFLIENGSSANIIDEKTGLSPLGYLVSLKDSYSVQGLCAPMMACHTETPIQRLGLIRWFVARSANPDLKGANGKSARELVAEMSDAEQRAQYEKALEGKL